MPVSYLSSDFDYSYSVVMNIVPTIIWIVVGYFIGKKAKEIGLSFWLCFILTALLGLIGAVVSFVIISNRKKYNAMQQQQTNQFQNGNPYGNPYYNPNAQPNQPYDNPNGQPYGTPNQPYGNPDMHQANAQQNFGQAMPKLTCPNCGNEQDIGLYCEICGNKLK